MDFLEPVVDFLAEPEPMDLLGVALKVEEQRQIDNAADCFCVACGHALTAHTRGMVVHDRCLMCGGCNKAVLTESAARKVKHGLLP